MIRRAANEFSNCACMATQCIANKICAFTPSNPKVIKGIEWVGERISSPQNRLILGATALMSQPFIDLHNRRVDEETRKTSAARTVAKIIAGTTTGFLVRYGCIKAMNAFCNAPKEGAAKWKSILFPKKIKNITPEGLAHFKNAFGSIAAIAVMVVTNFLIDAPLTKYLTNKFIAKTKEIDKNKVQEAHYG